LSNYLNKIKNDSAATAAKRKRKKETTAAISLLKTLEDMLRNRIKKKEEEVHKTNEIAVIDKLLTEIETLHCVLGQSFCQKTNGE
jgi:hypothetical protein